MSLERIKPRGMLSVLAAAAVLTPAASLTGQPADRPGKVIGELTADDVYVRSGPSMNHYPICKLQAGDRVTIAGESGEWYEIVPPPQTYSLISGDYVDMADDQTGVVNGNNVRVRAGSLLNDNMYTVQLMLSKGAEVTVLGRNPDGFLRIRPPSGATLWMHRRFVEIVPQELLTLERELGTAAPVGRGNDAQGTAGVGAAPDEPITDPDSPFAGMPATAQRRRLVELDGAARQELQKPAIERRVGPLIEQYRAIAAQTDDELAARYAGARVDQLTSLAGLVETLQSMRRLDEEVESQRRALLEDRAKIREKLVPIPTGLDITGELRTSALYPPGSVPRRFRLVDTSGSVDRTIAYVELPAGMDLDEAALIGRYVGVRASAKRLQPGGIDPVPVYVAEEIVPVQADSASAPPPEE